MLICRYKVSLRYLLVFLIAGILSLHTASAQSLQFKNYSVKDGLPSSEVYCAIQDTKGYMWFCTDRGVSRFNGYEFETFTKSNGLPDNTIFECMEDYKGRIWFRSFSGKLSYFYNDSIFRIQLSDSLNQQLAFTRLSSISVDSSDNLYMSTYGLRYIIRINLKKNYEISLIPLPQNTAYIATVPKSNSIINGFTNDIFYSTDTLYLYSITQKPPAIIKQNTFIWDPWKTPGPRLHDKAIKFPDGKIATSQYSRFMVLNHDSILFSHNFNSLILNIIPDKSNAAWIVLEKGEPVYYENGEIVQMPILVSLKDKHVTCVTHDLEGGLWFTTLNNGVYYLQSGDFKVINKENGLSGNKVNFLTVAPDKKMWLIVNDATINIMEKDSIRHCHLTNIPEGSYIKDILFHSDSTVWLSGDMFGVAVFSGQYPFQHIASNNFGLEYNMVEGENGNVWVVGINRFSEFKRSGTIINRTEKKTFQERIFTLCKGDEQKLWIATFHGLFLYNNDSVIYLGDKYPVLKNRIDDIKKSTDGNLWIATRDTGVIVKTKNSLTHITIKDGLISNFCECVCIDYKNNIWVGSNKGLSHIYTQTDVSGNCHIDSIRNINSAVLYEVNQVACVNNMVYVATNNGLVSFNMDKVTTNHTPPPIYITSLKVNNKKISPQQQVLNLVYNENYVIIKYIGLAYSDAGHVQYKYKMEGIDTGWVFTRDNEVQYPKLSPGDYTFIISARNKDGVWSIHPASIHFIIAPPFWATWWARAFFGLVVIGFGYWRIKTVERREKRKVEINKQLTAAELRELKAQFDPHFFFNNLNTLSHLIDSSPENAQEYVDELSLFYHYTLNHRKKEFTELAEEIEQAKRYCTLLRIRFGTQLKVEWNINSGHEEYYILTNSLQLLLENVIKHNTITTEKPLLVEINSTEKNGIIVRNLLQPKKNVLSSKVGLTSINDLYLLLTGKTIKINQTPEYFSVEIPLLIPKEYEDINYRR